MTDDDKNEQIDETEASEEAPEPGSPEANRVPEGDAEAAEAPEGDAEAAEAPEGDAEAEAPEGEAEAETPAAPAKPARSRRHVPRAERRQRSKPTREKPKTRKPIVRVPKPDAERGPRQERRGVVVSDKGDKTIVVKVDVVKIHPKYKKVIRRTVRFHAHDEQNTAGVGDTVRIVETRPLSKTKRWRLAEIVEKAR